MNINNYSMDIYKNTLSIDILGVIQKHTMKTSTVQYEILCFIYSRKHWSLLALYGEINHAFV